MKFTYGLTLSLVTTVSLCLVTSCLSNEEQDSKGLQGEGWETVQIDRHTFLTQDGREIEQDTVGVMPQFHVNIELRFPTGKPFLHKNKNQTGRGGSFVDSVRYLLVNRLDPESLDDKVGKLSPQQAIEFFLSKKLDRFRSEVREANEAGYAPELISSFVYDLQASDSLIYLSDDLVSLVTAVYEYTGGAHGLETTHANVFDFEKKQILTPILLFKNNAIGQINQLIQDALTRQNGVESAQELEELGYFNYLEAKVTPNMYLSEEGVTFVYNPYEIAASFVGTVRVFLPYNLLSNYFNPQYHYLAE